MIEDAKKLVETGDIVYEALWYIFERGMLTLFHYFFCT
jgi:hypothetical protein